MEDIQKIIERIKSLEARMASLEGSAPPVSSNAESKKITLREFLISKQPTDDVKKTLVVGYYLEKFNGTTPFSASDLIIAFENAREKKPININDKVNMSIRNGYMAMASQKKDGRKCWYVTRTGEDFVSNSFK